jgi:hypothetical protein
MSTRREFPFGEIPLVKFERYFLHENITSMNQGTFNLYVKGANAAAVMVQRLIKTKMITPKLLVLNIPWIQMVSKVTFFFKIY